MREPTQCVFWSEPERVRERDKPGFEQVERFVKQSHLWRDILRCRECGQLYFVEFYEEVDWEDGEDPQYWTYVPIESYEDANALLALDHETLWNHAPALHRSWPKGEDQKIYWVRPDDN